MIAPFCSTWITHALFASPFCVESRKEEDIRIAFGILTVSSCEHAIDFNRKTLIM